MNCNIIKDLIILQIDDLASEESKEFIKEHIKECNECKIYLEKAQEGEEELIEDEIYDADKREKNIIKKIKNQNNKAIIMATLFGAIITSLLTTGRFVFQGFIIMPILGAFIYLKFRKKFLAVIIVFSIKFLSFFLPTAALYDEILDGKFMYLFNTTIGAIQISSIFALFTFAGVIIGILIEKIFLENGGVKDESEK